jgi:hypothetical protein
MPSSAAGRQNEQSDSVQDYKHRDRDGKDQCGRWMHPHTYAKQSPAEDNELHS